MRYWRKPLDFDEIDIPHGVIHIDENQCKGCGFCVEYCPKDVLKLDDAYNIKGYHPVVVVRAADCVQCQLCEIICPEFSIFVTPENNHPVSDPVVKSRREGEPVES